MRTTWEKVRGLIPEPEQIERLIEDRKVNREIVVFDVQTRAWSVGSV